MSNFKTGDRVRLKVSEHRREGTIVSVADGMAAVSYEHRPGVFTKGYYPVEHLELVQGESSKVQVPATKPQATTAEVLGGAK